MFFDKITPLAAPPGHSLTGEPGRWPWERRRFVDPNQAIDYIIERLETGGGKEDLAKMMLAGVTVEELVPHYLSGLYEWQVFTRCCRTY